MLPITSRLKDAIWSIRREFGLENDLDRIILFLVRDENLSPEQLDKVFIVYPKRVPEDYKSALLARIQQIVRQYYAYRLTKKGYHRILKGIYFLENVIRFGFEGCLLVEDKIVGFQLELRPEHLKKK